MRGPTPVGGDIVFNEGEYAPGSSGGQELIAHELAHVVQQGDGGGVPDQLEVSQRLEPRARRQLTAHRPAPRGPRRRCGEAQAAASVIARLVSTRARWRL